MSVVGWSLLFLLSTLITLIVIHALRTGLSTGRNEDGHVERERP